MGPSPEEAFFPPVWHLSHSTEQKLGCLNHMAQMKFFLKIWMITCLFMIFTVKCHSTMPIATATVFGKSYFSFFITCQKALQSSNLDGFHHTVHTGDAVVNASLTY